ncbi:MAG: thioesterase [Nannocystis sp.]|nr:hotdog domain-containing protein [Nannocystis sp.]MBA3550191.1 thioesterase [Nannocystis sp.]
MSAPQTHLRINSGLCGTPVRLADGLAEVRLEVVPAMAVDDQGLVHGGFVFGLADHAAMLAVNDPNVVLSAASTRFLRPLRVGDVVVASAVRGAVQGRKHTVTVEVRRGDEPVMTGEFLCVVLDRHVLAPGT